MKKDGRDNPSSVDGLEGEDDPDAEAADDGDVQEVDPVEAAAFLHVACENCRSAPTARVASAGAGRGECGGGSPRRAPSSMYFPLTSTHSPMNPSYVPPTFRCGEGGPQRQHVSPAFGSAPGRDGAETHLEGVVFVPAHLVPLAHLPHARQRRAVPLKE